MLAPQACRLVGDLALLSVFVLVELRHPEPTVELPLFRIPAMTPSPPATLPRNLGSFAVLFLVISICRVRAGSARSTRH